jgi:hypothetical protein
MDILELKMVILIIVGSIVIFSTNMPNVVDVPVKLEMNP